MKRGLLVSVLLGALLFVGVTVAQEVAPKGHCIVYGHGTASCGAWVMEREVTCRTSSDQGLLEDDVTVVAAWLTDPNRSQERPPLPPSAVCAIKRQLQRQRH